MQLRLRFLPDPRVVYFTAMAQGSMLKRNWIQCWRRMIRGFLPQGGSHLLKEVTSMPTDRKIQLMGILATIQNTWLQKPTCTSLTWFQTKTLDTSLQVSVVLCHRWKLKMCLDRAMQRSAVCLDKAELRWRRTILATTIGKTWDHMRSLDPLSTTHSLTSWRSRRELEQTKYWSLATILLNTSRLKLGRNMNRNRKKL